MEVDFAFLADSAQVVGGKLYLVGGAFDTIWAKAAPVVHPHMSLVLRLQLTPAETGRQHRLEVNIIDDDGRKIGSFGGTLEVGRSPGPSTGRRPSFLSSLDLWNLKFERFGDYSFEIMANDFSLKSIPLRLAKQAEAGTA